MLGRVLVRFSCSRVLSCHLLVRIGAFVAQTALSLRVFEWVGGCRPVHVGCTTRIFYGSPINMSYVVPPTGSILRYILLPLIGVDFVLTTPCPFGRLTFSNSLKLFRQISRKVKREGMMSY